MAAAVLASRERAMRAEMRGGPGYSIFSDALGSAEDKMVLENHARLIGG